MVVAAQDSTLGKVGIQLGSDNHICDIVTAEGGSLGFHEPAQPGLLHGIIQVDATGKAVSLTLTSGANPRSLLWMPR